MKEIFIYNKVSGRGLTDKKLNLIISYLKNLYPNIIICPTKNKGDAYIFTNKYIANVETIFVLGGDGTIHDVVSAIACSNYNPLICIIPNGTMNDLAHSLNIPRSYKQAIDLAKQKKFMPCSIMKVNDRYAIYATAIGRFASTSYNTKQTSKNKFGKLPYFVNALKDLWKYQPISMTIKIDDKIIRSKVALFLTCTGKYVAGFPINNQTNKGRLILIKDNKKKGSLTSIISIIKLFLLGIEKIANDKLTTVLDFNKINITLNKPTPIVLDGEKYVNSVYNISIIPKQIKFISNVKTKK